MVDSHRSVAMGVQLSLPDTVQQTLAGRLEEGTWADVTPLPRRAPTLELSCFDPAARGTFEAVVETAAADVSDRDWPSAMAAAAGPSRVLLADGRGFTGDMLQLKSRGSLS